MLHEDFFRLIAKYKFAIAIENALCDDYVTEKFWRPLHVGTIPIVLGSPKIKVGKKTLTDSTYDISVKIEQFVFQ